MIITNQKPAVTLNVIFITFFLMKLIEHICKLTTVYYLLDVKANFVAGHNIS